MKECDFDKFLDRVAKLDSHKEVVVAAVSEADKAERYYKRETRKYVVQIGQFLFFMRHVGGYLRGDIERVPRPSHISDSDFGKYGTVVEALVGKGALPAEALDIFPKSRKQ